MGLSAHPSINKGCDYFGVKLITVPIDPVTLQTDLKAMERAITSNTIAIVGSAPGWPHGVVDDIPAMSKLALRYNIGLHVDACLGGFVIAFSEIGLTYAYKKFFIYILPEQLEPNSLVQYISTDYKFAISFAILDIVLLYRPNGIFKGKVI